MKKSLYSADWSDTIRPAILKRDGYKCTKCKVQHRAIGYYENNKIFVDCDEFMQDYAQRIGFKLVKIFLQVHHKNGNKKDNEPSNLVTLCIRCHFEVERPITKLKKMCKGIIYPKF